MPITDTFLLWCILVLLLVTKVPWGSAPPWFKWVVFAGVVVASYVTRFVW